LLHRGRDQKRGVGECLACFMGFTDFCTAEGAIDQRVSSIEVALPANAGVAGYAML